MSIKCGIKTCIHNSDGNCTKTDLELNYLDSSSVLGDATLPDGTKLTTYVNNAVGYFMGLQCRDFKMDYNKARQAIYGGESK
jgi:hypothetical protein